MKTEAEFQNQIEEFIRVQVIGRGLDERTEKAYRQDLEHFYLWLGQVSKVYMEIGQLEKDGKRWEEKLESYLCYLSRDRGLRLSTITRKYKVLTYYIAYLAKQGMFPEGQPLKLSFRIKADGANENARERGSMSRYEVDALFQAVKRERENLGSDFRKRVCLRDLVMLELLFYHGIEVSELLRLEIPDYNRRSGVLVLRGKHGKRRENGNSEKTVGIFAKTVREHMDLWLEERMYFEHGNEYHNRMFLSKLGKPLSMKMVVNMFNKYRVLAGIERMCTPKDLKNSFERYAMDVVRGMG